MQAPSARTVEESMHSALKRSLAHLRGAVNGPSDAAEELGEEWAGADDVVSQWGHG